MVSEDRDLKFAKALRRHLRRPFPCLDAELLAAYHERSLEPEQYALWTEHLAGCADCKLLLADLKRSEGLSLEPEPGEAPGSSARASRVVGSSASRRGTRWFWLAPAGAFAAVLLLWVAWHELPVSQPTKGVPVQTARVSQPPLPALAPESGSNPGPASANSALREKPYGAGARRMAEPRRERSSASSNLPSDAGEGSEKARLRRPVPAGEPAKAESEAILLKKNGPLREEQSRADAQNLKQLAANAPRVAGPAPQNQVVAALEQKTKQLPAAPAATAGYLDSGTASALETAPSPEAGLIVSADGVARWRTGPGGRVEFSSDEAKTWTRQFSGVLTELLAGSAPSAETCWIVGRAGTVILTTDGGRHWKRIKAPFSGDPGGVRALDASRAILWNSQKTQSFRTLDGGLTWQPISAP